MDKKQMQDQEMDQVSGGGIADSIKQQMQQMVFQSFVMGNASQDCTCYRCKGTVAAGEACYTSAVNGTCVHNACYDAWKKELY